MYSNNNKNMNALVVSLKYNPGHFSHLIATYNLFEEIGYKPYLFINKSFEQMDEKNQYTKVYQLSDLEDKVVETAVFWFPSLKNIIQMIRLKMGYKCKLIYVYHEPFDSVRNYYKGGFGLLKIGRVWLINLVNVLILMLSDHVILPSEGALKLYEKKYRWINKKFQLIPLLFSDELDGVVSIEEKKYIAYIGTVAEDHAFDEFVRFAVSAMQNNWFENELFLIATGSTLTVEKMALLEPFVTSGKLIIQHGSYMSNQLINDFFRSSTVVWNAYHRSMQSGVLPKAYMFGSPVIVLKQNSNTFIDNHETGVIVEHNNDVEALRKAVNEIISNKKLFYGYCRQKFLNTFFYRKYLQNFKQIVNYRHD